ncbi:MULTISPECIES: ribosome biogenesis GTPase Der [Mesoplasma]|uniref:GTPase Der n=2 Tax=Mesoplasma TaxID=46239 RepID=A0A2R3NZ93_MESFO|nr:MULTISPECIES: ribosome biogenesis GTPase Der [Mesoplasma]AGY41272.1 GTP-binding protein EngA [Mesoplasma florum W37]ATZ21412.1 GTP-binding protein EngA [Mesoplasma tabanidae]AVN59499.1 GTPase Der [Mesoplasma florum]AVN63568.1 GTPase Der [Mesoplasma florum]AVN64259.1 GTPase Der [Mesoplasma florum]
MKKGIVAIVGRPNVGKSSLFNRIIREKKSIVEDTPGVTRDRIYGTAEWLTREFIVIDTGGITLEDQPFAKEIKVQAEIAMEEADVIVFLLNHQEGLSDEDKMIAKILYKTKKPIVLAVNKYDKKTSDFDQYEYMSLGFGEPILISATHGIGTGDLLDDIIHQMPSHEEINKDNRTRVSIIGRPNVGKSSLVNSLIGEERMIVSDIPGTTLDAVDSVVKVNNIEYTLIDTAGIRKKSKIFQNVEKYSYLRSLTTINGSDVVLLMLDASVPISDLDTNIGGLAFEERKPIIIIANKWDLVENKEKEILKKEDEIRAYFKYLAYAKILFVSAHDKTRITKIFTAVEDIRTALDKKIKTSVFNEVLNKAQLINPAPNFNGGRLKIYYGAQVEAYLPTFVLFVNNPDYVHFSYKRFLENQIRLQFGFEGVPMSIIFRERK